MWADVRSGSGSAVLWSMIAIVLAAVCLAIGLYLGIRTGVSQSFLYRDANAIAGQPFFYGILEVATGSILLMSGSVLLFVALTERFADNGVRWFLLGFGLLTVALGFDDLLMLHESAWFFHWRLEEKHVYALYGVILLLTVGFHPRLFLRSAFPVLGLAFAFLALAMIEDELDFRPMGRGMEDYLEIFGFSFWSSYILATAVAARRHRLDVPAGATDRFRRAEPSPRRTVEIILAENRGLAGARLNRHGQGR